MLTLTEILALGSMLGNAYLVANDLGDSYMYRLYIADDLVTT